MTMLKPALAPALVTAAALSVLQPFSPSALCSDASRPNTTRPNIIIFLADDMGYGDSSINGGWIKTPNMEKLAAEGLRFTDFHASGAVCSPTRAGLLTGRYQQRAGIPNVVFAMDNSPMHYAGLNPDVENTVSKMFKQAGYATALFGKWHLGYYPKYNPVHHGFDTFRGYVSGNVDYHAHQDSQGRDDWWDGLNLSPEKGYTTTRITRHTVDFIKANRDKPFFIYVAQEAVHDPYQGPNDPPLRVPGKKKLQSPTRPIKDIYRDMMAEMDKSLGTILDTLRETGLAENTLVFFFSDNGATKEGSNAPLRGFKGEMWEGGHREPAVAWWPGHIKPGAVTHDLAISLDLMPTFLDIAGIPQPQERKLDGISLKNLLLENKPLLPDGAMRKLYWNGLAMREGQWKLVIQQGRPSLYNLDEDLAETTDLSEELPDRVQSMMADLEAWKKDVATGATPQPKNRAGLK